MSGMIQLSVVKSRTNDSAIESAQKIALDKFNYIRVLATERSITLPSVIRCTFDLWGRVRVWYTTAVVRDLIIEVFGPSVTKIKEW